jgi:Family of unknown function (DUF5343)
MSKLTTRYLPTTKNLAALLKKIVEGTAPSKFTVDHLKGIGFTSSNDRAIIPLLKDLGFLTADGTPTKRYLEYRDPSRSKRVLGEALREAYEEIFHINEHPSKADRAAIQGKFKSTLNVGDRVSEVQTMTFLALLDLADISSSGAASAQPTSSDRSLASDGEQRRSADATEDDEEDRRTQRRRTADQVQLRYNIEIHLPPTKDIEVYNAIFKSLKEHLLE